MVLTEDNMRNCLKKDQWNPQGMVEHLATSNSQKSLGLKGQEEEMPSERWVMEEGLTISICSQRGMQPFRAITDQNCDNHCENCDHSGSW